MKTVIGFDSWTGGAHHFARLVPAFKARGLDLKLLHLGSWAGGPSSPHHEVISGVPVRDISTYRGKNFLQIIDSENPEAVIFLSVDTFAHRAFNRYCRYRGIPTLHLYHGLVRVQEVDNLKPYKVNILSQSVFVLSRLPKALTRVWPTYIKSLIVSKAKFHEWRRFMADIYNFTIRKYIPISALDARTDRGAVYVNADIQHAVRKYGFREKEVTAVGNPDLTTFGLAGDALGHGILAGNDRKKEVIYIDTGLIYAGVVFNGVDDFLKHMLFTKQELDRQGKALVVKLHPQHYETSFPALLSSNGIELVQNAEFVDRLKNCAAAIVEPSTAALIPALIGSPVFLANYGKLAEQTYGEVLTSYPRSMKLNDLDKVNYLLDEEGKCFASAKILKWISENAGPLPAEQMPERVAAIVLEMIAEKSPKVLS
jgi:hypothetical protein